MTVILHACPAITAELQKAVQHIEREDVQVEALCGSTEALNCEIQEISKDDHLHILVGQCPLLKSSLPKNLHIVPWNSCFDILAPADKINRWLDEGAHLLTPSMLNNHHKPIWQTWGFKNSEQAAEFAKEGMSSLVFLDAGNHSEARAKAQELARDLDLPLVLHDTDNEFLLHWLQSTIRDAENQREIKNMRQRVAENSFITQTTIALFDSTNLQLSLADTADQLSMLFAADVKIAASPPRLRDHDFSQTQQSDNWTVDTRILPQDSGFLAELYIGDSSVGIIHVTDITTPKRTEEYIEVVQQLGPAIANAITHHQQRLFSQDTETLSSQVFQQAPVGILVAQKDGNIITANNEAIRLSGYDLDLLQNNDLSIFQAKDLDGSDVNLQQIADRHPRWQKQLRIGERHHREVWFSLSQAVGQESGSSWVVCMLRDISSELAIERYQRQAATVFSTTSEGIVVTDADGCIIDVNPSFSQITGYPREEVLGKSTRILKSGRHNAQYYKKMWQSLLETDYWQGEIWNRKKSGQIYPELLTINAIKTAQKQTTGYVAAFSDISKMKQSQERLDYLAHHDTLTGLPNRLLFNERLNQSIVRATRHGKRLIVFFIDLDRFKYINDSLSHQHGDELLKQVSTRLSNCIRKEDTVARISGDEFTVLLEDISSPQDSIIVVRKIMAAFAQPFEILNTQVRVTCSLGICVFPDDGNSPAELLKQADAAMYQAKEEGRNTYQFYTPALTTQASEQFTIENALSSALQNNQLYLVYQPQYRLSDQKIIGLEVLLRWQHPTLGQISPARFIPVAEQTGQIREIDSWVLTQACQQAHQWHQQGLHFGRIAVNVSGQHLQQDTFLAELQKVLHTTQLASELLEIEVTETFLMKSTERAIETLTQLQRIGVSIAIDDFGTGYSSMSYLKKLPVALLKIDQSFVKDTPEDMDDIAICKAIIALAKAMNIATIAEGIETPAQQQLLTDIGCDYGQGYWLNKPLSVQAISSLLQKAG